MKLFTDLFPLILFFVAYQLHDIYVATAVAIAAAGLQIGYQWLRQRQIENIQWVTLGLLVVFGGLTLVLRDPTFIKWKPTVINWLFAAAFLGSELFTRRSILRRMMDHAITLPDDAWVRLNVAWTGFFVVLGALNIFVAYSFAEPIWVQFKVFGLLGLTVLFVLGQGFYLARFADVTRTNEED